MKKLCLAFMALLCMNFNASSQDYDFGDVSMSELKETYYPTDSTASAAMLYRKELVTFFFNTTTGFQQEREVHVRIKIYDKEGLDWANEKIILYQGGNGDNENVSKIKGYTYNLVDGKIEQDKLRKKGIFEEDASENYVLTTLTMPNVKVGSVIEYKYKLTSPFPVIDDINLQYSIPVKKLDVYLSTPQFFSYKKVLNPKAIFVPSLKESTNNKRITSTNKTRGAQGGQFGGSATTVNYSTSDLDYFDLVTEINEVNIPALSAESFAGNLGNYRAKLSMELVAFLDKNGVPERSFGTTWDKVSKSILESDDFGGQLNKTGAFKSDVQSVISEAESDFEKAFILEQFLKSKVKWNGNYGKYAQNGVRRAYKEGSGNAADLNLMLVAMLKTAGVTAFPVLVSTRNNGVPLFPTRDGFNYVVAMVQSGEQYMIIDATEPFSINGVLPERVLNWQGRVLRDNGSSYWINLKPTRKSVESTMLNVTINEDLTASGKVRKSYNDYMAYFYRKSHTGLSEEDHIKALEKDKGDLIVSDVVFDNDKNLTQPVKISYAYEAGDVIDEIGDKLYFSPLLFLRSKENPFKLDERKYPIDFVIPVEDKYLVNILLPEGYKVESLPQSEAVRFKNEAVSFSYIVKANGKYLQLSVDLSINEPVIRPEDYKEFKAFYSKIIEKQGEQIVLTKA